MSVDSLTRLEKKNSIEGDATALAALQSEVSTPEDAAYLKEAERDLTQARADLGKEGVKLVLTPDGIVETADTVQRVFADGQDRPGAYDGGGRE